MTKAELRKAALFVAAGMVLSAGALRLARAQEPPARGGRGGGGGGRGVQPIQQIKPGMYVVTGGGANSEVRVTSEGVILVDGKLGAPNYTALMEQIKSVTPLPVKYLIVTHHHADHTGNNQLFLDAGIPIIGTKELKDDLATYVQYKPTPAAPSITYEKEYTVKLGGAEAKLYHFGRAHTSGDSVVYFPDVKVVAVSDVIAAGPLVDYVGGGSAIEWSHVLEEILKLDFDLAVPGDGKPMTKAEVQEYKTKYDAMVAHIREVIRAGVTKDQLADRLKADNVGLVPRIVQLDGFWAEFTQGK